MSKLERQNKGREAKLKWCGNVQRKDQYIGRRMKINPSTRQEGESKTREMVYGCIEGRPVDYKCSNGCRK